MSHRILYGVVADRLSLTARFEVQFLYREHFHTCSLVLNGGVNLKKSSCVESVLGSTRRKYVLVTDVNSGTAARAMMKGINGQSNSTTI